MLWGSSMRSKKSIIWHCVYGRIRRNFRLEKHPKTNKLKPGNLVPWPSSWRQEDKRMLKKRARQANYTELLGFEENL